MTTNRGRGGAMPGRGARPGPSTATGARSTRAGASRSRSRRIPCSPRGAVRGQRRARRLGARMDWRCPSTVTRPSSRATTCVHACRSRTAAPPPLNRAPSSPSESRRSSPSCHRATSRSSATRRTTRPRHSSRVYWNVTSTGAPALVAEVTARLNASGSPFRLKVADHRFRLDRCDAAVLLRTRGRLQRARHDPR